MKTIDKNNTNYWKMKDLPVKIKINEVDKKGGISAKFNQPLLGPEELMAYLAE